MLKAEYFSPIFFLGAMAILIFGIRMAQIGLQLAAGDRLRRIMSLLTKNRFVGLGMGAFITVILQSSSASTVMLTSFASTGLITLTQSLGMILGADIGTTIVVILLSIKKISEISLLMILIGLIIEMSGKKKKTRYVSMVISGFGFVFFGMYLMVQIALPLKDVPIIHEAFDLVAMNPVPSFVLAVVFTSLIHNSATTIGIAIAMAFSGLLDIRSAIPIILGANVGTCSSALMASLAASVNGRRVAVAHMLFKFTGAALVLIFLDPFTRFVVLASNFVGGYALGVGGEIALSHLVFNVMLAILFIPFVSQEAWLIGKIMPEPRQPESTVFKPKYLDSTSIDTPAIALANARREIQRMADIVYEMLKDCIEVFKSDDREFIADLERRDDNVDTLNKGIKFYLSKLSQETLTPKQAEMQMQLVSVSIDLEEIGDIINKNLMELAEKKIRKGRRFSGEGWSEIVDFHGKVVENFHLMLSAIATEDLDVVKLIINHEQNMNRLEQEYRQGHIHRLQQGLKETFETSSIHLDLLSSLRRINTVLTSIAKILFPENPRETT